MKKKGCEKQQIGLMKLVTKFEKNYEVSDKQDVLAMCALQFASLIEINAINSDEELVKSNRKNE